MMATRQPSLLKLPWPLAVVLLEEDTVSPTKNMMSTKWLNGAILIFQFPAAVFDTLSSGLSSPIASASFPCPRNLTQAALETEYCVTWVTLHRSHEKCPFVLEASQWLERLCSLPSSYLWHFLITNNITKNMEALIESPMHLKISHFKDLETLFPNGIIDSTWNRSLRALP